MKVAIPAAAAFVVSVAALTAVRRLRSQQHEETVQLPLENFADIDANTTESHDANTAEGNNNNHTDQDPMSSLPAQGLTPGGVGFCPSIPSSGGFSALVGQTKLIEIKSLSKLLGVRVLAKAEFQNPGGSVKDRVAKKIIEDAEKSGALKPGGTIYEGTSGSTGISLTMAAMEKGYNASIYMPDDQAKEKSDLVAALGARVKRVRPVTIGDPDHFVNMARREASEDPLGFFADQFENPSNFAAHFLGTGKEIIEQTAGKLDAFVAAAGTGGTLAGCAARLKVFDSNITTVLVDPPGSSLCRRINTGVAYHDKDAEGHRVRYPFDTVTEGIGLNRITDNFSKGIDYIDVAYTAEDKESTMMSRWLLANDAIFCGSSGAVNCVGVVKAVKDGRIKPGQTVVTILCDSGIRHLSKFWNPEYMARFDLSCPDMIPSPLEFIECAA